MCPSVPVPHKIDEGCTDEDVILFLDGRKAGDPIPSNVFTEVDPFSIIPSDSPEGVWFLFNSAEAKSRNEGSIIKATQNGYWRSLSDLRIPTSTPTVGRKTTWEFYVGEAPFGGRTGMMMKEYQTEQGAAQGNNKGQAYSSLCRFFMQTDQGSDVGEQCDPDTPDVADGEYLECMLLSLLEEEEQRNFSLGDAANTSQVVGVDEQSKLELSSKSTQDRLIDDPSRDLHASSDSAKEDYMELNDLYSQETSSLSSDNSSLMSFNSDECFDAEALLRDIENDRLSVEEHVDYRFSVATSAISQQVVIQPPLPGRAGSNSGNLVVEDSSRSANSFHRRQQGSDSSISSPILEVQLGRRAASPSCSYHESQGSQAHSGSSDGSSTSKASGSKSIRRISKLGKRYCCFGSF